jgi:hypothetical protein
MHIILKNHLNELSTEFSYESYNESKIFEFFCNYCTTSKHFFGRFDPKDVTTDEDDAAIDGISIIIDGDLITTQDDAAEVFKTHKTSLLVDIIFTQSKSGEQFKKEEINNYKVGLEDFLSLEPILPNGKLNIESIKILNTILANLKKVCNRRPNAYFYYCTSGTYNQDREIKAAFDIIERYVCGTDLFFKVSVIPVGRSEILKLYANLSEKNEARLKLIDFLGMPAMPGIPESYIGIVNAKHFVAELLSGDDGNIKQSIFEENVRSFLGGENDVNSRIQATIKDEEKRKLFSILNNGITVVAPELTLTSNLKEISLTNYQIINGCQTSSTLYENRKFLDENVNVVVKFIESPDNDISSDIISATNSQSNIAKEAFHGLKNKAKLVQKYFDAQNDLAATGNKIYFERRENEYKGTGHQVSRIFDVRELARCFAAMFLNQPHNSARYVKKIFSASGENLFREDDHESLYYCSALALYKYQTLINGQKNKAHNYIKLRWHIIQLFKWAVHGKIDAPIPGAKKADAYAQKIIKVLTSEDRLYIDKFHQCQDIIDSIDLPSDDVLKRGKYTQDLMNSTETYFKKGSPYKNRDYQSSFLDDV